MVDDLNLFIDSVELAIEAANQGDKEKFFRNRQKADRIAKQLNTELRERSNQLQARMVNSTQAIDQFIEDLDLAFHRLSWIFLSGAIVSLALALLISWVLMRTIVKPLKQLTTAVKRNREDAWKLVPVDHSTEEVEQLAIAFNDLIQRVQSSSSELEKQIQALKRSENFLAEAKTSAEQANLAKSRFLANMSHELRTPLNSIIGFAQLLNRDETLKLEHRNRVGIINRSGEHLLSLINNILDISKIEAGKTTLTETDFDLFALLKGTLSIFELTAKQKGNRLVLECQPNVPRLIIADEGKLRQIIMNLLSNAVKFTSNGTIQLRVEFVQSPLLIASTELAETTDRKASASETSETPLPMLQFEVEDTGPGIAAAELEKLFTPFEQTATGQASYEGSGLGLSICKKFVQLMGGEISVRSTVGVGSCFSFSIPVQHSSTALSAGPERKVIGLVPGQPEYRLLIVDDLPENRQVLDELLLTIGFSTRQACNGVEALKIWRDWHPQVIWMDLRMPEMDGYAATSTIRENPGDAPAPVIVALTATALREQRDKILASGFDAFVAKPFQESEIWSILTDSLGVEFVYETLPSATSTPETHVSHTSQPLTAATLKEGLGMMPEQWWEDLYYAADKLKGKQALELIAQIPLEQAQWAQNLQEMAENYQFDQMLALLER